MALAIDGSTPVIAVNSVAATATVTTASFTPPAGSTLLVLYSANTIDPNDPGNPTITDSLGVHLSYTNWDIGKRPDAPLADGQVATWTAPVASSAAMTITVTNGAAGNRQAALCVLVLTGAHATPVGAHGKSSSLSAASIAQNFTGTASGSWGFIAVCDWNDQGVETAGTGCTLLGSGDVGPGQYAYGFARRTTADGTNGGTTTMNVTLPGTSTSLRWAWVEIVPAVTDVSGPTWQPPPPMPPTLLLELIYRNQMQWLAGTATVPATAETGLSALVVITSGTAVKVAPQTGRTVLVVPASGAGRKVAPETGTAELPLTASGIESTVAARAQTGTAVLLVRTSGAEVKVARPTAAASLLLLSSGVDRKVAPQTGATELLVRTAGTEVHQQAQTGRSVVFPRTSGQETNRVAIQTGRAVLALTSSGTPAKKTAEAGTTQLVVATSGAETTGTSRAQTGRAVLIIGTPAGSRKTAVLTGSAMLALTGAGSDAKKAPETGRAELAVRTAGLELKRAVTAGRATLTLTPTSTTGVDARAQAGTTRMVLRALTGHDCFTHRPSTGTTARPSSGTTAYALATTARPSTGTTPRPDTGITEDPC